MGDDVHLLDQLRIVELSGEDLDQLWEHYDADGSDTIDKGELTMLLEDVSRLRSGHGNVPAAVVDEIFEQMDANGDLVISRGEFQRYCAASGISLWYL
mmetsp:Transcript_19905/g.60280  ORF Transcript_19905/g.60280 Transcript_19905/m.60280 type:complete len:98 (+) Transcript_19905:105-398(+)